MRRRKDGRSTSCANGGKDIAMPSLWLTWINHTSWRASSIDHPQSVPDMNRFLNKRARRDIAFMVLLAWLFTLAIGVANACLLEPPLAQFHVAAALASGITDAPAHVTVHAMEVCADNAQFLPTPRSGVDRADPGPAPRVAVLRAAATPVALASRQMPGKQPATHELPIRLRYSRLVL